MRKKDRLPLQKGRSVSIVTLVKFSNVCAHDGRLYCTSIRGRKSIGFIQMTWTLKRYLAEIEFRTFAKELTALMSRYLKNYAIKHMLDQIGFVELFQKSQDDTLFD